MTKCFMFSLALVLGAGCGSGSGSGGSGAGDAGDEGNGTGGRTTGGGGESCATVACFRPYECVRECGSDDVLNNECCPCPAGMIDLLSCPEPDEGGCGAQSCPMGSQYCRVTASDVEGVDDHHECLDAPSECSRLTCTCLEDQGIVTDPMSCSEDMGGAVTVVHPGG